MIQDRLLISDDKTAFLLVGTPITVSNNRISPSPSVKNLGSWFDSTLSIIAAFYHLHNFRRITEEIPINGFFNNFGVSFYNQPS